MRPLRTNAGSAVIASSIRSTPGRTRYGASGERDLRSEVGVALRSGGGQQLGQGRGELLEQLRSSF